MPTGTVPAPSSSALSKVLPAISLLLFPFLSWGHEPEPQLPFARLHAHEDIEIHSHLSWDTHYFSEGRDALDGDSLISGSFELGWQHLSGGVFYGNSPDQSYDELQLALAWVQEFGDFEFYAGYTHFRFPFESALDHELGAGLVWACLPLEMVFAVDAYYSFDAEGYFVEFGAEREIPITDKLSFYLSGQFGMNQGYVSDGHDGANNVAIRLGLEYALTEHLTFMAHATYSWGISTVSEFAGDDQLIDFVHGGVGLQWAF